MQFKENRRLAWCVLGACVVGSIFGLGGYSIAREQHRLENIFNQGVDRGETTRARENSSRPPLRKLRITTT